MQRRTHIDVGTTPVLLPGSTVAVYTTAVLDVLATIYEDDEVTPATNPVVVDVNGEFHYKAADGKLWEKVEAEDAAELTFFDPASLATNTDIIHTNRAALDLVTGTNTGDQAAGDFNHDDTAGITGTVGEYNHPNNAKVAEIAHTNRANIDTIDQNLAKADTVEWRAIKLTPGQAKLTHEEGVLQYDDERKCMLFYIDETEFSWQVGRELPMRVYNNTAGTLLNGRAARVVDVGTGGGTYTLPYIDYGTAEFGAGVARNTIGIITHDIEPGSFGEVTILGWVNGANTASPLVAGEVAWLAASDPPDGTMTAVVPSSPDYAMEMGGCLVSDPTVGVLWADYLPRGNKHDIDKFFNGAILESHNVVVAADATNVIATLDNGGDALSLFFDAEFYSINIPATVNLAPGTDTVPLVNYVFIPESTKVLTANITGFPTSGQYVPVATVVCQSRASVLANGVYKQHSWTDHLATSQQQGHLADINKWIRTQNATWLSGVANTYSGSGTLTVNIATTTAGKVLQLHEHDFPIFASPAPFYVINDATTAYRLTDNLASIVEDALGGDLLTAGGRSFAIVLWGVVSELTGQCKLFINLPDGSYTSPDLAAADALKHTNYSIPEEYRGTGFLIRRYICQQSPGGLLSIIDTAGDELRGTFPNTVAGGSSASGDFDASGTAQAIMDLHTASEASPAAYDHSTFLVASDITGKLDKTASPTDYAVGFNSSVVASGDVKTCSAALTVTLEDYTARTLGEQFVIMAVGGNVTFAGVFQGENNKTILAQHALAVVFRTATGWSVFGVSL